MLPDRVCLMHIEHNVGLTMSQEQSEEISTEKAFLLHDI